MPQTHNVHDDINLFQMWEKLIAEGHTLNIIRDGAFENMLRKLQDVAPRIHKFKHRITSQSGQDSKVAYSKELGFHKTAAGKIEMFFPQFFVQGVMEEIGIEKAQQHLPGLMQHLQNVPSKDGFAAIVNQNSTGNHYRNKHIKVAVQPGQPVSG
jgi:hypothetical protein